MSLNERISKVIEYSGLTPSEFADEIDVQRSSISHVTSGRNKPSLEFIIKIKSRFPEILWDWLVTGEGQMLKSELPEVPEIEAIIPDNNEEEKSKPTSLPDLFTMMNEVCKLCHENDKKVMVDAEETWMQDAADQLCEEMMEKYNREKPIVWNTIQMYRTGRLEYMEQHLERAREKGYFIGYKIVRGAYMEKERARAVEKGYPDPIQPTKEASDKNYNAGIDFVMNHLDKVSAFFGTHNEISSELVMDKMKAKNLENGNSHVYFGQLYGMSDNITFYLSDKGYNVAKYLPYGPVKDVVPYLTRRAQENTSVAGQTGRELGLIKKELERRKSSR